LGRLVCLVGGIVKTVISSSHSEQHQQQDGAQQEATSAASESSWIALLCNLLQLGTNATRGCESAKVAWVQSTLSTELSTVGVLPNSKNNSGTTKRGGGVAVIVACLQMSNYESNSNSIRVLLNEACQLLASLCRYDDFRDPSSTTSGAMGATGVNTSSAHDHAMEFHRAGAPTLLIKIARGVLLSSSELKEEGCGGVESSVSSDEANERLASSVLTALRVLAVNDEIIQTMVALGVLPVVTKALQLGAGSGCDVANNNAADKRKEDCAQNNKRKQQRFVAASLGLLRNLCGNDEIKTNLCLGSANVPCASSSSSATPSVLPHLLQAMQTFPSTAVIQEHACGTLAAMALRRPANARAILDAGGSRSVLTAMKRHDMNVNVQRQGALAVRNIVSRLLRDLPEEEAGTTTADASGGIANNDRSFIRDAFLELGAEDVLRNIAGRHQGSVDEAYAALRDLGCTVSLVKFNGDDLKKQQQPLMFGGKHNSNFRPVYEESEGLSDGVESAVSQFGA